MGALITAKSFIKFRKSKGTRQIRKSQNDLQDTNKTKNSTTFSIVANYSLNLPNNPIFSLKSHLSVKSLNKLLHPSIQFFIRHLWELIFFSLCSLFYTLRPPPHHFSLAFLRLASPARPKIASFGHEDLQFLIWGLSLFIN